MRRNADVDYNKNVDYASLEQHKYKDTGKFIFYTCPRCGNEYLATFITKVNDKVMCIDCASLFDENDEKI